MTDHPTPITAEELAQWREIDRAAKTLAWDDRDRRFIAHARNTYARLLDEVERLRRENDDMRGELSRDVSLTEHLQEQIEKGAALVDAQREEIERCRKALSWVTKHEIRDALGVRLPGVERMARKALDG